MEEYKPKLVCFSCKFGWAYLANQEDLVGKVDNWIQVICSGKIDTTYILKAFRQGADGVLILGCPEGDCHYQDGNFEARKRLRILQKVLEAQGIERERLRIHLGTDPEGKTMPQLVAEMSQNLERLGPIKRIEFRKESVSEPANLT